MSNASTAAIVTTLRNAGPVLDSFVAYHHSIGFAHIYLFFDDPHDADLDRVGAMPGVTAIAYDASLQKTWRGLRGYPRLGAFTDSEVMARQQLNVEWAMGLARAAGHGWLLSIDADELFFSPNQSVADHFESFSATTYETIKYLNYEGVPVRDNIDDYFREVDIFKPPPACAQPVLLPALRQAKQTIPQLRPYFHFYLNGKSAVRLSAAPPIPNGVHGFRHGMGATNIASSTGQFILHYPCCGFESFWAKYVTLGRFADKWWGTKPAGAFHLESRDVVLSGGRDRALEFYQTRIAISDSRLLEKLLDSGVLVRLPGPRQIIEAAPPP